MNKPIYKYKDWVLDSYLEVYFCYYLQELQDRGFIEEFRQHDKTWALTPKFARNYLKQLKTKVNEAEYFICHPSTYTADFNILWTPKASNILFLDPSKPVTNIKNIPFRLSSTDGSLWSHVEIKSINESTTSSSISFVIIQKVIMDKYNDFIQKVQPFALSRPAYKKCLFYQTFFPKKVVEEQFYVKSGSWGKAGTSKIKFPIKTVDEYLKLRGYDNK